MSGTIARRLVFAAGVLVASAGCDAPSGPSRIASVSLLPTYGDTLFTLGVDIPLAARFLGADSSDITDITPVWSVSNDKVLVPYGRVHFLDPYFIQTYRASAPGITTIRVTAEGVSARFRITIQP